MAASPASKPSCAQAWCEGPDATGRTILFAACDSPESFAAFAWARANLLRQLDTLVLVHACDKDRLFGGLNALAEGQRAVTKFEDLCKQRDVQFRVVLAQGDASKVVAAAAIANKCELIVTGCRGLGPVKRALVGSVRCASPLSIPVTQILALFQHLLQFSLFSWFDWLTTDCFDR
jgi:nucleotide-binding universal stress UspA family protein